MDALPDAGHPAIGDLHRLLVTLRAPPYRLRIGLDREIRCFALLERLADEGIRLDDPADAATWLSPLICNSEADQDAVREVLVERARPRPEGGPSFGPPKIPDATAEDVRGLRPAPALPWAVLALGLVAVVGIGALLLPGGGGGGSPTAPWTPATDATAAFALPGQMQVVVGGIFAGLAWLLVALIRRREARGMLSGEALRARVADTSAETLDLFAPGPLRTVMRALREHALPYGRWVNIPASIRATSRAGGLPAIVFGGRPRLPEYLLLAEARGPDDQSALLARLLLRRLQQASVHVDAYAYSTDPIVVRHLDRTAAPEPLAAVAARSAGHRLLLVCDGKLLIDPLTLRLYPHLGLLRRFSPRVVLTQVPQAGWGGVERALAAEGFAVLPLTPQGLGRLGDWLTAPEDHPAPRLVDAAGSDFAARLEADTRLLRAEPLPPDELDALIRDLRRNLGPSGFRVLAASAVSPVAGAGLTVRLIRRIGAQGVPFDEAALARLTRLPWSRRSAMPAWLRAALLQEVTPDDRILATDTLLLLLADADSAPRRLTAEDRARLARRARQSLAGLDRADATVAALLDEADPTPSRRWTDLAMLLGAAVCGLLGGAAARTIVGDLAGTLDRASRAMAWGSPTAAWLATGFGVFVCLGALVLTRRAHQGRRPPWLPLASLWLPALAILSGAADLPENWRGAPTLVAIATFVAALSPLVARVARRRQPVARTWLLPWPLPWSALFSLALAGSMFLAGWTFRDSPDDALALSAVATELSILLATLLAVLFAARGMAGGVRPSETIAYGLLFAAGQTLGSVLAGTISSGLPAAIFDSPPGLYDVGNALELRCAGGLFLAVALGGAVRWPVAVLLLFAVALEAGPFQFPIFGINDVSLRLSLLVPAVIWIIPVATALIGRALGHDVRVAVRACAYAFCLKLIALVSVVAVLSTLVTGSPAPDSPNFLDLKRAVIAVVAVEWLFLRTTLRWAIARPTLRWQLWGEALLLLPCAFSVLPTSPFGWRGVPWLALPIAAWLARRHGTAALAVIGLALAPMLISFKTPLLETINVPGLWFAALLVARLAIDFELRNRIARTTTLSPLELGLLGAIVALGIATPRVFGMSVVVAFGALVPVLLILIGWSRIKLRPVIFTLAIATALGLLGTIVGLRELTGGLINPLRTTWMLIAGTVLLALSRDLSGRAPDGSIRTTQAAPAPRARALLMALAIFAVLDAFVVQMRIGPVDLSLFAVPFVVAFAFLVGWMPILHPAVWGSFLLAFFAPLVAASLAAVRSSFDVGPLAIVFWPYEPASLVAFMLEIVGFYWMGTAAAGRSLFSAAAPRPPEAVAA